MNTSFEISKDAGKYEWLTPPYIIESLGPFDLDPCSPVKRPWNTAKEHFTKKDNGLIQKWEGKVWCNPPYGRDTKDWLKKCSDHNNCMVLIFARTETKMFFDHVWNKATGILFMKGRPRFYNLDGTECRTNMPGAPSVIIAYGKENAKILKNSDIPGKFIYLLRDQSK